MLSFLIFFICCVHNIFIAIIADSYKSLHTNPVKQIGESDSDAESKICPVSGSF